MLKITAGDGEEKRVRYVADACGGAEKTRPTSAVSVFIPEAGDGLWETAKRLSEDPEVIEKSNPDLNFPLSGSERIVIFRAKK